MCEALGSNPNRVKKVCQFLSIKMYRVCVHVCIHTCICASIYVHAHTCVYVCVHMWRFFYHVGLGSSHGCKYLVVYFTGLYHLF